MTAETKGLGEVSEVEIDKCALDMSSCEDLPQVGADCKHIDVDVDDEEEGNNTINGKDDPDGSYVFVSRSNSSANDDPLLVLGRDFNAELVHDPEKKDVEVKLGELNVQNSENAQLCVEEDTCIVDAAAPSNNDVVPEPEEGSLVMPNVDVDVDVGQAERNCTVEEQNGTAALDSEPQQQLDDDAKREEKIELESARDLKENRECPSLVLEAADCESPQHDDGKVKSEEQYNLESGEVLEFQIMVSEVGDSNDGEVKSQEKKSLEELGGCQESQIIVSQAAECELDDVKVNSEEQHNLESTAELEKSQDPEIMVSESQIMVLESQIMVSEVGDSNDGEVKSQEKKSLEEFGGCEESQIIVLQAAECEPDGVKVNSEEQHNLESTAELEKSQDPEIMVPEAAECKLPEVEVEKVMFEEETKSESAKEVEESLESQITITESVKSESYQLANGEEKLGEENKTDFDIDVKENQESEIVVTDNVYSGFVQEKKAAKLASETDAPSETEIANENLNPDQNKGSLPTSHVEDGISQTEVVNESIKGSQKTSELNGCSVNAESLTSSTDCVRSEFEVETVPVGGGESLLAGADDVTVVEQEAGCGADDMKPETEVENAKSEMEVENGPDGGDRMWPANDVSSETNIGLGSIDPEEKLPTFPSEDVNIDSEVSNGVTEYACSQPISVNEVDPEACSQPISVNEVDPEYHVYDSFQNGSRAAVKTESEVENSSSLSNGDLPGNDAAVSRSKILDDTAVNGESGLSCVPEVMDVENVGDQLNGGDRDGDDKLTCQETEGIEGTDRDGISASSPEGSGADALDGQNVGADTGRRPFHFLIRIPRYDDDKLREQIRHAQLQVDEKTRHRDAIRAEIQMKRAIFQNYHNNFEAAKSEERAARGIVKSKRQEIDSVQFVINRAKNAISVEDIDGKIHNMEHMIQHETLPLKEEKHFIREIKQLKQLREQISSNMGSQDEVKQALDQRDQIEERLKILKKELDCLREKVSKAKAIAESAEKKSKDENEKLKELQAQFRAADDIRQEAYAHLQSLRKQLYEKNKHFRMYKDDATAANDYALSGDREALHRLCVNQVETIMELWNKNDEFRKEYVWCNTRSTLRRLKTLDGRSLGPDEQPPLLPNVVDERVDRSLSSPVKVDSVSLIPSLEQEKQGSTVEGEKVDVKSTAKVAEQKNQMVKIKKPAKPVLGNGSATVSGRDETEESKEEEHKQTKEELELVRKAEELRKEEAAARLKEQRRLEEKTKAKDALERKQRNAEKAQIRAELRAQKEAEQKEKEREKRARKKERKKGAAAEAPDGNSEGETDPTSETPTETLKEPEIPITAMKRPQKPSQFTKQSKAKSIPPPLRNRGKRRMQQWMWVILPTLLVLALFLLGNGSFSQNFWLRSFGF